MAACLTITEKIVHVLNHEMKSIGNKSMKDDIVRLDEHLNIGIRDA